MAEASCEAKQIEVRAKYCHATVTAKKTPQPAKRSIEFKAILRQNTGMATLSLTDEQVVQLVKQLPPQSKQRVLEDLASERDQWWQNLLSERKRVGKANKKERWFVR